MNIKLSIELTDDEGESLGGVDTNITAEHDDGAPGRCLEAIRRIFAQAKTAEEANIARRAREQSEREASEKAATEGAAAEPEA